MKVTPFPDTKPTVGRNAPTGVALIAEIKFVTLVVNWFWKTPKIDDSSVFTEFVAALLGAKACVNALLKV